jgi:penicillin-binding protein 1C
VAAYAAFARRGEWIAPTYRTDATPATRRGLVSPRTAFWITDILSDSEAREFVFGRGGSLDFPFPVAVKTGTSQAYHDNWTVGYSDHVSVGVWVGNFDRRPLRNSSGVTGAAPIFHAVMLAAERRAIADGASVGESDPRVPEPDTRLRFVEICATSGLTANSWCPVRRREWIADEAELLPCSWHHLTDEGLLTVWPPEYRQWAQDNNLDWVKPRPQESAVTHASLKPAPDIFRISSPPDGATYLIDPTLRREFQTLSLHAIKSARGPVEWFVDQRSLGTFASDQTATWPLVKGHHSFEVRDAEGRIAEATISVR